mgnify:FL=1
MTEHELKQLYSVAWLFFKRERDMREKVFPPGHPQRNAKLAGLDTALRAVTAMKDFAKMHVEESPDQVELFDVPERGGY